MDGYVQVTREGFWLSGIKITQLFAMNLFFATKCKRVKKPLEKGELLVF